jgi:hypothetical protein
MERNGWKNSKKQGVVNAVLWREVDTAISRHPRIEFDWAKAHSGILLNDCADQLATRVVSGTSYFPGPMIKTPPEEIESSEEFVMADEDATRWEDWDEKDHIAPGTVRVRSVGLAVEKEREAQEEIFKRFSRAVLGNSSDSPKLLNSEDENDSTLPPDLDEDSAVHVVTGNGFQVDQEQDGPAPVVWGSGPTMVEQIREQQEREMLAMIPDWMSMADLHMIDVEGMCPVKWDQFCDVVRACDDRQFAILKQRRFEQCAAIPSAENDAIVGSALVVWSEHYLAVMKSAGKQSQCNHDYGNSVRMGDQEPAIRPSHQPIPGDSGGVRGAEDVERHSLAEVGQSGNNNNAFTW